MYKFGDEVIKPIKNFENYGISNKGFVYKNLKYGLLEINYRLNRIKPYKSVSGYLFVRLSNKGKTKTAYIHKLVAEYFLEKPKGEGKVVHIDGNKENNRVENLKWISKEDIKKEILKLKKEGRMIKDISDMLGISVSYINSILKEKKSLSVLISIEAYEKIKELSKKEGKTISRKIEEIINDL